MSRKTTEKSSKSNKFYTFETILEQKHITYRDVFQMFSRYKYSQHWKYDQKTLDKLMTIAILNKQQKLIQLILDFEIDPIILNRKHKSFGDNDSKNVIIDDWLYSINGEKDQDQDNLQEQLVQWISDMLKNKMYMYVYRSLLDIKRGLKWKENIDKESILSTLLKPFQLKRTRKSFLDWLTLQREGIQLDICRLMIESNMSSVLIDYFDRKLSLSPSMFLPFRHLYNKSSHSVQEELRPMAFALQDLYKESLTIAHNTVKSPEFCSSLTPNLYDVQSPLEVTQHSVYLPFLYYQSRTFSPSIFDLKDFETNKPYDYDIATITGMTRTNIQSGSDDILTNRFSFQADPKWLYQSNAYISTLPIDSFFTIVGYTQSAYKILNRVLYETNEEQRHKSIYGMFKSYKDHIRYRRHYFDYYVQLQYLIRNYSPDEYLSSSDNVPLFHLINTYSASIQYQLYIRYISMINDFGKKVIVDRYIEQLQKIINEAPPISSRSIVFRGQEGFSYKQPRRLETSFRTFVSTSLKMTIAKAFLDNNGSITKLILEPGTKALYLRGISSSLGEDEVLLSRSNQYKHILQQNIQYRDVAYDDLTDIKNVKQLEHLLCDTSPMTKVKLDTIRVTSI